MITKNNKIKCDICGKFISISNRVTVYTPDSPLSIENIEDYDITCYKTVK